MSSEVESQDESEEELTASRPAIGPAEEADEWIGATGDTHYAREPVNVSMIRFYASMVQTGNPSFWDQEWAEEQWGGIYAPPGMMLTLQMGYEWSPGPDPNEDKENVSAASVPLPERFDSIINTQTETVVHEPIRVGTWLNWDSEVTGVSEQKDTALGQGHFVTTKTYLRNKKGELLAEDINSMLRYDEGDSGDDGDGPEWDTPLADGRREIDIDESSRPDDRYSSIEFDEISEGETAHSYEFASTYKAVIHDAAATRDFYPVHHDPEWARSAGTETIFLNTMALQGLVDRSALEWAGPEWRVAERTIRMAGSALAGKKLTVEATVEEVSPEDDQVTLDVAINQDGRNICPSSVTIQRG